MPQVISRWPSPHLRRLVTFADPSPQDVCLDVATGDTGLAPLMSPWVAALSTADVTVLPADRSQFTLVTSLLSLSRTSDPGALVHQMLRVLKPGGRLVMADLARTRIAPGPRERIERLRDPAHTTTRTIEDLAALVTNAGGTIRRLEAFSIERPVAPWLAQSPDAGAADLIRDELMDELNGGPTTGTCPRLVAGELWFTQSWAYIAAHQATRPVPTTRHDLPADPPEPGRSRYRARWGGFS